MYSLDLIKKLGLKHDQKAYIVNMPNDYLPALSISITNKELLENDNKFDWLQAFYKNKNDLENDISLLKSKITSNGQLWLSWPKKSSNISSDLSDKIIRENGLANGLVDVKVISIDETWSALKFVYPLISRS